MKEIRLYDDCVQIEDEVGHVRDIPVRKSAVVYCVGLVVDGVEVDLGGEVVKIVVPEDSNG